mmetsp:Transcript_76496/g.167117  ORF Transcript_76496/g.167117 Transcript_76496/m.167117 type:complete len:205 (-) Transcript_76496:61-675(-)
MVPAVEVALISLQKPVAELHLNFQDFLRDGHVALCLTKFKELFNCPLPVKPDRVNLLCSSQRFFQQLDFVLQDLSPQQTALLRFLLLRGLLLFLLLLFLLPLRRLVLLRLAAAHPSASASSSSQRAAQQNLATIAPKCREFWVELEGLASHVKGLLAVDPVLAQSQQLPEECSSSSNLLSLLLPFFWGRFHDILLHSAVHLDSL